MKARIIIVVMLLIVPSLTIAQSVPSAITYHGRITQHDGSALPYGFYSFYFKLYDAASAGKLLWSEYQDAEVFGGYYQVELGATEPIPFSALNSPSAYLEVTVDGEIQSPRQRIVSVPFALKAEGVVPEGGIILGAASGNTTILNYGYTQLAGNISGYYLYQKNPYSFASRRVPAAITYQGKVTPLAGATVGHGEIFSFGLYDAWTAGTLIWSESQTLDLWGSAGSQPASSKYFSAVLGAVNPLTPLILNDKNLWLSTILNGQALHPREKLTAAAYALKIESPVPPGGIVLSATTNNQSLTAKKFTQVGPLASYYLYSKDAFITSGSVPLLINYQGYVSGLDGSTISGTRNMQFSIFDSLSGSTLLWTEMQNGVSVTGSIYHVLLGSVNQITPDTFSGFNAYLQISIAYGATLQTLAPRTRLTSVPFALQAEGTMPTSAIILGSSPGALDYNETGFIYSGSTISGYPLFKKADVDTKVPIIEITKPFNYSAWTLTVPLEASFSDELSGIDTSSFVMYLNGTTVDSGFAVTETGVTGNIDAEPGSNILRIEVSDKAGNRGHRSATFFLDITGSGPAIAIYPPDAATIYTSTPEIRVDLSSYSGIDHSSLSILVNGVERREEFGVDTEADGMSYIWQVSNDAGYMLNEGSNTIVVHVGNYLLLSSSESSTFTVNDLGLHPSITSLSPTMALAGETIKIIGTNFGSTIGANEVTFFDGYAGVPGQVMAAAGNTIMVKIPREAMSGPLKVKVGDKASEGKNFIVGFGYGLVANSYPNPTGGNTISYQKVSVVEFNSDNPGRQKNRVHLANANPFDIAVTPDGSRAYVTAVRANKIYMLDTALADSETITAVLDSMTVDMPRYVVASPTEPEIFVGTSTGYVYRIKNNYVQDGATYKVNLGGRINGLAISPLYQRLYVAKSLGTGVNGEAYYIDIDKTSSTYMQATKIKSNGSLNIYRNPIGITIKPDQSEVYVANNNSNGTGDALSFSVFSTHGNTVIRNQGATITPPGDTHDIGQPRQMVFDPRGQLFYATFAGTGAPSTYTNNIGAERWRSTSTNFDAATKTEATGPNENPRGIAVSPGGKWIFTASYGAGSKSKSELKILDHAKVKLAIDMDSGDTTYNLTQDFQHPLDAVEWLDVIDSDTHPLYKGMIKYCAAFDGPENIAFHDQPVIELYPKVIYLAEGGQREGTNVLHVRVNPIYGNSITVNLNDGSTEHIMFPGDTVTFRLTLENDYGDTDDGDTIHILHPGPGVGVGLDSVVIYAGNSVMVDYEGNGGAKAIAHKKKFPSDEATIIEPPQELIQMLFAEACTDTDQIVYDALASVVKNRLRLTRDQFNRTGDPGYIPDLKERLQFMYPNSDQITSENASDRKLIKEQLRKSITHEQFKVVSNKNEKYKRALTYVTVLESEKTSYDKALRAAGNAGLDLSNTLTKGRIWNLQPDLNKSDVAYDITGGAFTFYSPNNDEWGNSGDPKSIAGALQSGTTTFPTTGNIKGKNFEEITCGVTKIFCVEVSKNVFKARYLQVVVVKGLPKNCREGFANAPEFVFIRYRDKTENAVIEY